MFVFCSVHRLFVFCSVHRLCLCFVLCVDCLSDLTSSFLVNRDKWRAEIQARVDDLKKMERELGSKEQALRRREVQLMQREKKLELQSQPPVSTSYCLLM